VQVQDQPSGTSRAWCWQLPPHKSCKSMSRGQQVFWTTITSKILILEVIRASKEEEEETRSQAHWNLRSFFLLKLSRIASLKITRKLFSLCQAEAGAGALKVWGLCQFKLLHKLCTKWTHLLVWSRGLFQVNSTIHKQFLSHTSSNNLGNKHC
jgi:hypothetical protein